MDEHLMIPAKDSLSIVCAGATLERAPRCPGVYRFYSADDALLYVGKSIDIRTRLNSHFLDAREPGPHQRMMSGLHRVQCELTAGDVGAQLRENAAIKAEQPLYNRRQRQHRKLWTQRLQTDVEGFLQVVAADFCPQGERQEAVYGLFRSRRHLQDSLRALARDQGLCLRMLGHDKGKGPCFAQQLKQCRGACAGQEDANAHNERLLAALEIQRIAAWPFPGAIYLREHSEQEGHELQPREQFHVLHHWSYLGSFEDRDAACAAATTGSLAFDRDCYRIVLRALRTSSCELYCALTHGALDNPFKSTGT